MPTYVYSCKACGHGFEQRQSFSDDALVTCPQCSQDALRKVFNSVGIVFKGSGFYSTDAGATTGTGRAAAEGAGTGAGDATSTPAGESSPSTSSGDTSASATATAAPTPAAAPSTGA